MSFVETFRAALRREEGQGLPEYSLTIALIALIAIAALLFLGQQIGSAVAWLGHFFDFFLNGTPMP